MVLFIPFVVAFLMAKGFSLCLYRKTWDHGLDRKFHVFGVTWDFLSNFKVWILLLLTCFFLKDLSWDDYPNLHFYALVVGAGFSLASIGRLGVLDLQRWFWIDRILILLLWLGLIYTPVFLYPWLIANCCLQYVVSGSAFSPGYSNLLGYEFLRNSFANLTASLVICGVMSDIGFFMEESYLILLLLTTQVASYVQQGLGKSFIGEHILSWVVNNRLDNLVVNAYLRGWLGKRLSKSLVLKMAKIFSKFRVVLCFGVWAMELSWFIILFNPSLYVPVILGTMIMHACIWLFTGFVSYLYLLNHVTLISFTGASLFDGSAEIKMAIGFCILLQIANSLWLRLKLSRATDEARSRYLRWVDPADHLMAWWDSPYMRMYSYEVKTQSGEVCHFPVTAFSPYDTFLTDVHTHIMLIGHDWDIDPTLDESREQFKTGVWGLVIDIEERDRLYALADSFEKVNIESWTRTGNLSSSWKEHEIEKEFRSFFESFNHHLHKNWFKRVWRWPDFPGEDWVPDRSPLIEDGVRTYGFTQPIEEVRIRCIKTFYHKNEIELISDQEIARFSIPTEDGF